MRRFSKKIEAFWGRVVRRLYTQKQRARLESLIEDGTVIIGEHTYGHPQIDEYHGSQAKVIIGRYCSISKGVIFVTGGIHPPEWVSTYPLRIKFGLENAYKDGMPSTRGDIVVGSDVWIGTDVMVLSGVKIGNGAIIAARSVVTKDVPDYSIVAGTPARVIKMRFSEDIVSHLNRIKWWNWNDEQVKETAHLLSSEKIEMFVKTYQLD